MLYLCSAPPSRLCLDLYLPFCLALLYFYLLWLLRLSLPYLTPAAQYDPIAIIMSVLFDPVRELWKNILSFYDSTRFDRFGRFGRFDFQFQIWFRCHRLQFIFQIRFQIWSFDYSRLQFILITFYRLFDYRKYCLVFFYMLWP